jgi:RNA polymerase sigma-70 factor (ECF subfamily)
VTQRSDEDLLCAYREGDTDALAELIRRYRSELFNFLVRFVGGRAAAEDVFQETFLQIHLSSHTFDETRRFKPWLFTIAANKGRDYLRKQRRHAAMPLSASVGGDDEAGAYVDLLEGPTPEPGAGLDEREVADLVRQAIERLAPHHREILLLAYFQRFNYNQIAEALGIPLGTVKSRLHSAVASFRRTWEIVEGSVDEQGRDA